MEIEFTLLEDVEGRGEAFIGETIITTRHETVCPPLPLDRTHPNRRCPTRLSSFSIALA